MALTLDSSPSTMKRTTTVVFQVSDPVTAPTTSNTTAVSGGQSLAISNVNDLGGGVYTLIFVVPDTLALLHDSVTGYAWTITVDAENVVTGNIPLLPQPGFDYIDTVSLTLISSLATGYADFTPVSGDQCVYAVRDYPKGLVLTVNADTTYSLSAAQTIDSNIPRYFIRAAGTVGATEILTNQIAMAATVDNVNSNVSDPNITGTCSRLHSRLNVPVDTNDIYNTVNMNDTWSFNTDPVEIEPYIVVPSNLSGGATPGSYNFDHNLIELDTGDILLVYREGSSHVGNDSRIMQKISSDGGKTFGAATFVTDDASWDVRGVALSKAANGNIIMFFVTRDNGIGQNAPKDIYYIVSTDNAQTWSARTSVASLFPDGHPFAGGIILAAWGTGFQTSQGLMQCVYSFDKSWVIFSTDNGLTWGNRKVVHDIEYTADFYNETTPVKVTDDYIVMFSRRQNNQTKIYTQVSDDGGLTWSSPTYGEVIWTTELIQSPPSTRGTLVGDDVYMGWGARKPLSSIFVNRASKYHAFYKPSDLLDEDSITRKIVYLSTFNATGDNIDFGMPDFMPLPGIDYTCLMAWYDNADDSPNTLETDIYIGTCQRW